MVTRWEMLHIKLIYWYKLLVTWILLTVFVMSVKICLSSITELGFPRS
jgi:hypothetical protein